MFKSPAMIKYMASSVEIAKSRASMINAVGEWGYAYTLQYSVPAIVTVDTLTECCPDTNLLAEVASM